MLFFGNMLANTSLFRSFAILRNKPITFKKTPSLPTTRHTYESPDIHTGFLQLVSSYTPLDESFVSAWNDGSDPRVSATTYLALQNLLAQPPTFLQRSRASTPSSDSQPTFSAPVTAAPSASGSDEDADVEIVQSEPTAIQKADLLITQQWLRLIVWQSSFRQSLLSWTAAHDSMHFAFPLAIARSTANVLQSLPSSAVEVHGMGIFEKIFEIGTWCMNVLGAIDRASAAGTPIGGIRGAMGMDFIGTGDLGVLGVSRKGVAIDPLEFFVRTLSATPNSRTQFAERLLMFAQERPGGMRMALTPSLNSPVLPPENMPWTNFGGLGGANNDVPMGNILGEVGKDKDEVDTSDNVWTMSGSLDLDAGSSSQMPSLLGDSILSLNTNSFSNAAGPSAVNAFVSTSGSGTNTPVSASQRQMTSALSMPSLNTTIPFSNWANDVSAASADWSYDLTSPTIESNAFGADLAAYSSGTGTPAGTITPGIFSRQSSGDSLYQYQARRPQAQFGTSLDGGGGSGGGGGGGGSRNSNSSIGMTNE